MNKDSVKLDISENTLNFHATCDLDDKAQQGLAVHKKTKDYAFQLEFFKGVKPDVGCDAHQANCPQDTKSSITGRHIQLIIVKAEDGSWDKLQKGSKLNFVKCDWDLWRDEDDEGFDEDCKPPSSA